jgi:exopolysaccharide biosynthesis polyprenyl glycosylphosphotransferase
MAHKKKNDFLLPLLTVTTDVAAIEASFLFSYWLRFYSSFTELIPVTSGTPPLTAYFEGSLFVIPVWLWLFKNRGLYKPRRINSFSDEFFVIVRIVVIGMLVVMGAAFFYRGFSFSRVVFAIISVTSVFLISAGRFVLLKFERWWYLKGHDLKNVIIAGTSSVSAKISRALTVNQALGYRLLGYCARRIMRDSMLKSAEYLGPISSVPHLIRSKHVDVVLIALNEKEQSQLPKLIRSCQGLNAEMMMVPDILELMTSLVQIRHIEGIPFLGIKSPALSTWNFINKRIFDIIFALCLLIVTSPLFLLIAIVIKIDSRGPVFYKQERIGINGEMFRVIKFRSMRIDAEKKSGPVWSRKDDPRVTGVGKFLRRFSLDELPQFINVLRGDMSVVGPRPERSFFVEKFKKRIPRYLERHRVKTGLTGWAQVNGLRGNASITERTKYDIYYVENWSLVFDIKIILKTIRTVLFGKDAY